MKDCAEPYKDIHINDYDLCSKEYDIIILNS